MAADQKRVASDLECIGDRIIDACLDAIAGNGRDDITGQHLDVAVGVGKGAVGCKLKSVKETGVNECVARKELQDFGFQCDLGLNALASRRADVLTKANRPCLRQDRFTQAQGYLGVGGGMRSLRPSR